MATMRMRDHNPWDLALAGLTAALAVAAVGSEVVDRVSRHRGQRTPAPRRRGSNRRGRP